MKILANEFRKMFFYNNGWLIFIVLIVYQITALGFSNKTYNLQIEHYKSQYQIYLAEFGGEIDNKKTDALNIEEERIFRAEEKSLNLFRQLNDGEITVTEYDKELEKYEDIFEQKMAFTQLQSQYNYAEANPEHRFVMYENGWYIVMHESSPNYILTLCVILLVIRCFCPEYETEMYGIIFCTKNGRINTFRAKILVSIISIIICGFITALMTLAAANIKFGLNSANHPIQSLRFFSMCEYNITICQCFALIWILKMLALCIIGMVTVLCCVLLNKSMPVFFVGGIINVLPYFIFDLKSIVQFVPHLGLSLSGYYFSGVEYASPETGEYLTETVPIYYLIAACIVGIAILEICLLISSNMWSKQRLKKAVRKA